MSVCWRSDFNMLRDPTSPGGLYTVAYTVDSSGKDLLLQLAREAGHPDFGCSTCTSDSGTLEKGYRAEVRGTDLGNGLLQVTSARTSNNLAANEICAEQQQPPVPAPTNNNNVPAPAPVSTTVDPPTDPAPSVRIFIEYLQDFLDIWHTSSP